MGDRRLTIGVTVNLGHYENLRVEVEGEPGESARELAGFLDGVLATFGRADPPTAGLIDRYRERVLAHGTGPGVERGDVPSPDTEVPPLPEGPGPDGPVEEVPGVEALMYAFPSDTGSPGEVEHGDETGVFEAFGHGEGEESWLPAAGQESPGVPAATGETDPAGPSALFPGTPVCQECRVPVSPAEEKLSRLFASRVLCRSCLKKMQ
jgi:hypothetical protein